MKPEIESSYIVSVGILDKISVYFNNVRGSIDGDVSGAEFLQNCLVLVASLVGISTPESVSKLRIYCSEKSVRSLFVELTFISNNCSGSVIMA